MIQISSAVFYLGSAVAVTEIDYYCMNDLAQEANDKYEAEAAKKKAINAVPESEVDSAS